MKKLFVALALSLALGSAAHAQSQVVGTRTPVQATNYSLSLGTTPTQIWPAATVTRTFSALVNSAAVSSTSPVITCSYFNGATTAPNAPGTFQVLAGSAPNEHNFPAFVNPAALWCVSSAAATPLTAAAVPN